jgi:uncharacterized protein with PIN domain
MGVRRGMPNVEEWIEENSKCPLCGGMTVPDDTERAWADAPHHFRVCTVCHTSYWIDFDEGY